MPPIVGQWFTQYSPMVTSEIGRVPASSNSRDTQSVCTTLPLGGIEPSQRRTNASSCAMPYTNGDATTITAINSAITTTSVVTK
jgi:hypothetical protein